MTKPPIPKLKDLIAAKLQMGNYRMTVRVAAKQANIDEATFSRLRHGAVPSARTFIGICKWLGVDPREVWL